MSAANNKLQQEDGQLVGFAQMNIIPIDTQICYKIFPGNAFDMSVAQLGQTDADWSALYAQFSLDHAIAYLPNHFDRGHSQAMLVSLHTKRPIKCFVYADKRYCDVNVSSETKASLLRQSITDNIDDRLIKSTDRPLLELIGTVHNMFVVIYDSDTLLECAVPHSVMNSDNFNVKVHAVFTRDPNVSWMVGSAVILSVGEQGSGDDDKEEEDEVVRSDLKLTKDERVDMSLLAVRVQAGAQLDKCTWIDCVMSSNNSSSSSSSSRSQP